LIERLLDLLSYYLILFNTSTVNIIALWISVSLVWNDGEKWSVACSTGNDNAYVQWKVTTDRAASQCYIWVQMSKLFWAPDDLTSFSRLGGSTILAPYSLVNDSRSALFYSAYVFGHLKPI